MTADSFDHADPPPEPIPGNAAELDLSTMVDGLVTAFAAVDITIAVAVADGEDVPTGILRYNAASDEYHRAMQWVTPEAMSRITIDQLRSKYQLTAEDFATFLSASRTAEVLLMRSNNTDNLTAIRQQRDAAKDKFAQLRTAVQKGEPYA